MQLSNKNMFYISYTTIEKTFQSNLHSHENIELLLFTNGSGYIQTINQKIEVKKGDFVIVNPNTRHCEISNNLSFYAIGINQINMYLKETFTKKIIHFTLNSHDYSSLNTLYTIIFDEANNKNTNHVSIIENLIDSIFKIIVRYKNLVIKENSTETNSELVFNIKNIINEYYYTNIKLDDVAVSLSQSKSTICHEFKKEMGISIIQYKINRQLEEACNLLTLTDMSISTISSMVGFNTTSYFTKYFKKRYGVSPKEFRKNNQ
jgi:AraC-like DNA-binding protein